MRFVRATLLVGVVFLAGCLAIMGIKQVNLVHSSVDFNRDAVHNLKVADPDMAAIVKRVTSLGEKRDLLLVSNNCSNESCEFVLKRKPVAAAKTEGSGYVSGTSGVARGQSQTTTYNLTFSSRFFGRVSRVDGVAVLEMVGVPVINEKLSCPPVLERQGSCKPELFNVQGDQTPAQSFRAIWGVDISGQAEAETITGIFAELQ